MNHSLVTADRTTHLKIVAVSLVAAIAVILVGITARIADTGTVIAIAQMSDGSFWSDSVPVVVTLSACLEEGLI